MNVKFRLVECADNGFSFIVEWKFGWWDTWTTYCYFTDAITSTETAIIKFHAVVNEYKNRIENRKISKKNKIIARMLCNNGTLKCLYLKIYNLILNHKAVVFIWLVAFIIGWNFTYLMSKHII
jgi:hypothetical protein